MKKSILYFLVFVLMLIVPTTNVLATSNATLSQDENKIVVEFGEGSSSYVETITSQPVPDGKNYVIIEGDKYSGYANTYREWDGSLISAIHKSTDTSIYFLKSDLKDGYFPNDNYAFTFYDEQGSEVYSTDQVAITNLRSEDETHYKQAKELQVKGVQLPVAGNKIADSLKNAKVIAKFEGESNKEDLLAKKFVRLEWSEVIPETAHYQHEGSDGFARITLIKDEEGFINLNGFDPSIASITITIGEYSETFTEPNLKNREMSIGLKATDEFLEKLNNAEQVKIKDASEHEVTIDDCSVLYDGTLIEDKDALFEENKMYNLSVVYEYLRETLQEQLTTKFKIGYKDIANKGGMGYGGPAICQNIGLAQRNSTFFTTSFGKTITDIEDISMNSNIANELKDIVSDMIFEGLYEGNNIKIDYAKIQHAIDQGKKININTKVEKKDEVPTSISSKTNDKILGALDIEIFVQVEGEDEFKIEELSKEVTYEYNIPGGAKENTEYYILREHGDEVSRIDGKLSGDKVIFKSDKFSTYALVSKTVTSPNTPVTPSYIPPRTDVK